MTRLSRLKFEQDEAIIRKPAMLQSTQHLPRWLYESLPVCYMLAAALVLMLLPNPFGLLAFGSLYCCGALIWCLRSFHRRTDPPARFLFYVKPWILPTPLYELLPFLVTALGLLLLSDLVGISPLKLLALPLLAYGALRLTQRSHHRRHKLVGAH